MKNRLVFCLILASFKLVNGGNEVTSQVRNVTYSVDVCTLQVENGTCDKNIKRYYYYPLKKYCLPFKYTGCGGNLNNFDNSEECMKHCPGKFVSFHQPLHCFEELDKGLCKEQKQRFYYNWRTGRCEQFVYSGCYGNNNRFTSFQECMFECKSYEVSIQLK